MRLGARLALTATICSAAGYLAAPHALGDSAPRRIPVTASKFAFDRQEIRVRKGEAIALVLGSTDFVHGFSIPDLDARVDVVPGRTVELVLRPPKAGRFVFLCDNFCGEGHDRMAGFLVVE